MGFIIAKFSLFYMIGLKQKHHKKLAFFKPFYVYSQQKLAKTESLSEFLAHHKGLAPSSVGCATPLRGDYHAGVAKGGCPPFVGNY